jgi:hypothetical protein
MEENEIILPEIGSKYYYVRVLPDFKTFQAKDDIWVDCLFDRTRYAKGNFFTTLKEAEKVAEQRNDIMRRMPPKRTSKNEH